MFSDGKIKAKGRENKFGLCGQSKTTFVNVFHLLKLTDNKNRNEMSADMSCFPCIQFTMAFKG